MSGRLEEIRKKRQLIVEQYSLDGELLFSWRIRPLGPGELYQYPTLLKELMNNLAPRQSTAEVDPELAAADAMAARGGETGPDLGAAERRTEDMLALARAVIEALDVGDGAGWSPVAWVDDPSQEREEEGTLYLHSSTIDATTLALLCEQAMSRFDAAMVRAVRFPGGVARRPGDPAPESSGDDAMQPERPAGDP